MVYEYHCRECGIYFDADFPIGKAPKEVSCPECSKPGVRAYRSCNFVLNGGGWPSKSARFNAEMTKRNEQAGERMRRNRKPPVRTVAHDFGGGDVREVT